MCEFKIVFFLSSPLFFFKSCRITKIAFFPTCRELFEATGREKKKGFFALFSEKAVWWLKGQTASERQEMVPCLV